MMWKASGACSWIWLLPPYPIRRFSSIDQKKDRSKMMIKSPVSLTSVKAALIDRSSHEVELHLEARLRVAVVTPLRIKRRKRKKERKKDLLLHLRLLRIQIAA